jgi:hypothetical protein
MSAIGVRADKFERRGISPVQIGAAMLWFMLASASQYEARWCVRQLNT